MSTLNVSNISDGTDTVDTGYVVNGSAKASFRYNQNTPSIDSSENVASITDDSTGGFTVNYTSSFASYETQRFSGMVFSGTGRVITARGTGTTSTAPFRTTGNGAAADSDNLSTGTVLGGLA